MNNNDYTWFFILTTLFNTNLGLTNLEKNTTQEERQNRIESKLNEILELLKNERR